jgi:23S rRNA (cytosine1962-C5)-methyltransferase
MELSGLSDIRWLHDDAMKFVEKEIKRGNLYDVIQMDPPAWGMGAKREKWKLEDLLPSLIEKALQILAPGGLLIVNTYSPKVRQKELLQLMLPFQHTVRKISIDELWMQSNSGKDLFYGDYVRVWK